MKRASSCVETPFHLLTIRPLARKLGDRAAAIETVRGLGYRFVVA